MPRFTHPEILSLTHTHPPCAQDDGGTEAGGREPGRLRTSLLIGLVSLFIYNVNGRGITAGDTYPARYLPFAIVQ